jgi:hypothetical protein
MDDPHRPGPESFEHQAARKPRSSIAEFLYFLTHNKKWWLTPVLVVLILIAGFVILGSTAAGPFIYTLF